MNTTLVDAAESMHGTLHGTDSLFAGVSTDTRTLQNGELFFALSGPNFDGGEFVSEARDKGAAGAVVGARVDDSIAQILVGDTRLALGELGAVWRQQQSATVVGITGSNGKTTLKDLTSACLSQSAPTLATAGNLNNDIGMPLMLLRIEPSHRYAVLEMGANHAGEIAYLTSLARPDIVVITNAGMAHLEGFGSVTGVAHAKGEILQGEPRPDVAILNAEDDYYEYWRSLVEDIDVLSFGLCEGGDVHADRIVTQRGATTFCLHLPGAAVDVRLPLVGLHNVRNACAAAAVATALDVPADRIAAALASMQPIAGRLQPVAGRNGSTVYDDSYNANPVSVMAAAEFMAQQEGQNWIVLGDMFELGDEAEVLHRHIGRDLREAGIHRLFALGDLSAHSVAGFGDDGAWFQSIDELIASVSGELAAGVNVLVKGSRSMGMERVVEALREPQDMRREA